MNRKSKHKSLRPQQSYPKRRKRGRPKLGGVLFKARLGVDTLASLQELAQIRGVSIAMLINHAVLQYMAVVNDGGEAAVHVDEDAIYARVHARREADKILNAMRRGVPKG